MNCRWIKCWITLVVIVCLNSVMLPCVAEFDRSNWIRVDRNANWCGAKGLWILSRGYNRDTSLDRIKQLCDPDSNSNGKLSLTVIADAGRTLGLGAQPVECNVEWLCQSSVPSLTVHRLNPQNNADEVDHCLVVLGVERGRFVVVDPFFPAKLIAMDQSEFAGTWTGKAVLIARSSEDLPQLNSEFPIQWLWGLIGINLVLSAVVLRVYSRYTRPQVECSVNPMPV